MALLAGNAVILKVATETQLVGQALARCFAMDLSLALANDNDLGLTASAWTQDPKHGERLAQQIKAGVVMINDHLMAHGLAEVFWGGFKCSGIGRSHGTVGMDEMTQVQSIVHDHMPKVFGDSLIFSTAALDETTQWHLQTAEGLPANFP